MFFPLLFHSSIYTYLGVVVVEVPFLNTNTANLGAYVLRARGAVKDLGYCTLNGCPFDTLTKKNECQS